MTDIEINKKDLKIDTYRSSGKGGQNVNKTESAVRITHVPTGIVITCQDERSQGKNKEKALRILKLKLKQLKTDALKEETQRRYDSKGNIAFGNRIRSYIFTPHKLVKDHRTGLEVHNVEDVLDGNLDQFIDSYLEYII